MYENLKEQETIVLKQDHTYSRNYLEKQSKRITQETGTWKYEHIGGPHISLDYYDAENPTNSRWDSKPIEKWFGKLYLGMDEDGARLYRKVN